jgi:hypothetical protein
MIWVHIISYMSSTLKTIVEFVANNGFDLDVLISKSVGYVKKYFELLNYLNNLKHTQKCLQYEIIDNNDKINKLNIICNNYYELIDIININYNKLKHAYDFRKKTEIVESVDFDYEIRNITSRFNMLDIPQEDNNLNNILEQIKQYIEQKNKSNNKIVNDINLLKDINHTITISEIQLLQNQITIYVNDNKELQRKKQLTISLFNKKKQEQELLHDDLLSNKRRYILLKKNYEKIYNTLR